MNHLTDVNELCRPEFSTLDVLDLSNNHIKEIPIAFVHFLSGLKELFVSNNDLPRLPPLLGYHRQIKTLAIDGNPLKTMKR